MKHTNSAPLNKLYPLKFKQQNWSSIICSLRTNPTMPVANFSNCIYFFEYNAGTKAVFLSAKVELMQRKPRQKETTFPPAVNIPPANNFPIYFTPYSKQSVIDSRFKIHQACGKLWENRKFGKAGKGRKGACSALRRSPELKPPEDFESVRMRLNRSAAARGRGKHENCWKTRH